MFEMMKCSGADLRSQATDAFLPCMHVFHEIEDQAPILLADVQAWPLSSSWDLASSGQYACRYTFVT